MIPPLGVAPSPLPEIEGTVFLPDGRRLGYAEFGDPTGTLVLWFHGTPGARRQIPVVGRRAAERLGLRLVCVERPGVGASTDYIYPLLRDMSDDIAIVADRLGHERFMVAGLSGGGPYALACAHDLPARVIAVAVLGSVVPTVDDEEVAEGLLALTRQWNETLRLVRWPVGVGLTALVRVATPLARPALETFSRLLPSGDQRVLRDPEIQSMFIDDLVSGTGRQCRAALNDLILFGRPWGFHLADVSVPVFWWHGDADPIIPIDQAYRAASLLQDVEFVVRPGESHLGEFACVDQVLEKLAAVWRTETGQPTSATSAANTASADPADPADPAARQGPSLTPPLTRNTPTPTPTRTLTVLPDLDDPAAEGPATSS